MKLYRVYGVKPAELATYRPWVTTAAGLSLMFKMIEKGGLIDLAGGSVTLRVETFESEIGASDVLMR